MSWRDELRQASFRGVPFYVKSATTEVGRRSVVHEIPFNDTPYPEDFGKAAGNYDLTGYVIQNRENQFNYFTERDALIAALETAGPGKLVHPFLGELQVVLFGKAQIEETFDEGGIAKFTMKFVEAGVVEIPIGVVDQRGAIEKLADGLITAAGVSFTQLYDPTGPNFLTDAIGAAGDLEKGLQMVQNTLYRVQATSVAYVTSALMAVAEIRGSVASIISAPASIVEALKNTFKVFRDLLPYLSPADPTSITTSALALTDYGKDNSEELSAYGGQLDPIPQTTPTRMRQQENRNAMVMFLRVGGLAEASAAAVNVAYTSYDQAYKTMQLLVAAYDNTLRYLADVGNDMMYDKVAAAKPSVVGALLELGASLPPLRSFTVPTETYPMLVLAYRLYNDLTREQELIDRNRIAALHPGFPQGGIVLEVVGE